MKITGDYLEITEQEAVALFDIPFSEIDIYEREGGWLTYKCDLVMRGTRIRARRGVIKKALVPKKNAASFFVTVTDADAVLPLYCRYINSNSEVGKPIAANPLTINKTCGELREIIAWCEEK